MRNVLRSCSAPLQTRSCATAPHTHALHTHTPIRTHDPGRPPNEAAQAAPAPKKRPRQTATPPAPGDPRSSRSPVGKDLQSLFNQRPRGPAQLVQDLRVVRVAPRPEGGSSFRLRPSPPCGFVRSYARSRFTPTAFLITSTRSLIVTSTDGCRSRGCRRSPRSPTCGSSSPSPAGPKTGCTRVETSETTGWGLDFHGAHLIEVLLQQPATRELQKNGARDLTRSTGW